MLRLWPICLCFVQFTTGLSSSQFQPLCLNLHESRSKDQIFDVQVPSERYFKFEILFCREEKLSRANSTTKKAYLTSCDENHVQPSWLQLTCPRRYDDEFLNFESLARSREVGSHCVKVTLVPAFDSSQQSKFQLPSCLISVPSFILNSSDLTNQKGSSDFSHSFSVKIDAKEPKSIRDTSLIIPSHSNDLSHKGSKLSKESSAANCTSSNMVTIASVYIDVNFDVLNVSAQLILLKKFSKYLGLEMASLSIQTSEVTYDLKQSSRLKSGLAGKKEISARKVTILEWVVGCGSVSNSYNPPLVLLNTTASNNMLNNNIGARVLFWHVSNFDTTANLSHNATAYPHRDYAVEHPDYNRSTSFRNQLHFDFKIPTATKSQESLIYKSDDPTAVDGWGWDNTQDDSAGSTEEERRFSQFDHFTPDIFLSEDTSEEKKKTDHEQTRVTEIHGEDSSYEITEAAPRENDEEIDNDDVEIFPPAVSRAEEEFVELDEGEISLSRDDKMDSEIGRQYDDEDDDDDDDDEEETSSPLVAVELVTRHPTPRKRPDKKNHGTKENKHNKNHKMSKKLEPISTLVGRVFEYRIPTEVYKIHGAKDVELLFLTPAESGEIHQRKNGNGHLAKQSKNKRFKNQLPETNNVLPTSWVKLNSTSRSLYGLPLEAHIGKHKYIIAALNKKMLSRYELDVVVQLRPTSQVLSHEFEITVNNLKYERASQDVSTRIDLLEKVARAFGDHKSENILITDMFRGSVRLQWSNLSLPVTPCPYNNLQHLMKYILKEPLDSKQPSENFQRALKPHSISSARFISHGSCKGAFPSSMAESPEDDHKEDGSASNAPDEVQRNPVSNSDDGVTTLLYIMIPMIATAAFLLIVLLTCVCCYIFGDSDRSNFLRSNTDTKESPNDYEKRPKKSSAGNCIPIIFANELKNTAPVYPARPVLADQLCPRTPPPTYSHSVNMADSSFHSLKSHRHRPMPLDCSFSGNSASLFSGSRDGSNNENANSLRDIKGIPCRQNEGWLS